MVNNCGIGSTKMWNPKFLYLLVTFTRIISYFAFFQCLKFKTDQAQEAKKMEKLNNIFFTLMARGPDGIILFSASLCNLCCIWAFHGGKLLYSCPW